MARETCDPLVSFTPENCPVRTTMRVIGGKWKPLILFYLKHRAMRFGEFRRMIPDATQKVLTQQLRELEEARIVTRTVYPQVPPKVEYSLSAQGETLRPVMEAMAEWGTKYRELVPITSKRKQAPLNQTARRDGDPTQVQV